MPYKDIESFKRIFKKRIDDDLIWEWADSLQPYPTPKLLYFLQFWMWARKTRVKGQKRTKAEKKRAPKAFILACA